MFVPGKVYRRRVLYKAELLAKIFELYVRGMIDFDRAARFSAVVDRGHVPYLLTLLDGYLSEDVKSHLLALGLMNVQSKWSEVEQQFQRDVPSGSVDVIKLGLNDDGQVFQDYVIRDVHIPTRLTERIETPPKDKRARQHR